MSSTAAINAGAISDSPVIVPSSETTNGYTFSLSAVTGSSVGSNWSVANGGPVTLKSRNSIAYVDKSGHKIVYNGNDQFVSTSYMTTYQIRTVATSKLTNYLRLAKVEAAGHSVYLNSKYYKDQIVYMNAYC